MTTLLITAAALLLVIEPRYSSSSGPLYLFCERDRCPAIIIESTAWRRPLKVVIPLFTFAGYCSRKAHRDA
jgi:hypothetical protein